MRIRVFLRNIPIIRNSVICLRILLFEFQFVITKLIPRDRKLFLFGSWFGERYTDSSKYMYEYFLSKGERAVWLTKNKKIYNKLLKMGKPVVMRGTIKSIFLQLRAKTLFSSVAFEDFNRYLITNAILIDLNHGYPIKDSGWDIKTAWQTSLDCFFEKELYKRIKIYLTASSLFIKKITLHAYPIKEERIIFENKPRADIFYDDSMMEITPTLKSILDTGKRIVSYLPTHRSAGKRKIHVRKILDLPFIENICAKNNYIFLIKKHYYHRMEDEDLKKYPHIIDITKEDVDVQSLLNITDVLISDYSACYIDFLNTNKPIILYAFDLEEFMKNEREFYIPFDKVNTGNKPKTRYELNIALKKVLPTGTDGYEKERAEFSKIYFSKKLKKGRARKHTYLIVKNIAKTVE